MKFAEVQRGKAAIKVLCKECYMNGDVNYGNRTVEIYGEDLGTNFAGIKTIICDNCNLVIKGGPKKGRK